MNDMNPDHWRDDLSSFQDEVEGPSHHLNLPLTESGTGPSQKEPFNETQQSTTRFRWLTPLRILLLAFFGLVLAEGAVYLILVHVKNKESSSGANGTKNVATPKPDESVVSTFNTPSPSARTNNPSVQQPSNDADIFDNVSPESSIIPTSASPIVHYETVNQSMSAIFSGIPETVRTWSDEEVMIWEMRMSDFIEREWNKRGLVNLHVETTLTRQRVIPTDQSRRPTRFLQQNIFTLVLEYLQIIIFPESIPAQILDDLNFTQDKLTGALFQFPMQEASEDFVDEVMMDLLLDDNITSPANLTLSVSIEVIENDGPELTPISDHVFTQFIPYVGLRTTPMDPFDAADCYFGDQIFAHTLQQCACTGNISVVPDDVVNLWYNVSNDINGKFYDRNNDNFWWSCEPENQALVWLSSGNTRDSGDLFQRFVNALMFIRLNGTVWDRSHHWLSDVNECQWTGIQCDEDLQITSLELNQNNVHGSIPSEISKLLNLQSINFSRNHLTGTVPVELFAMPKLEYLKLTANMLRGSIPTAIGQASTLKHLSLNNNLLFGKLVTEIGNVTTLESLNIAFNEFWRGIPTEIGFLTNLRDLVIEDNRISGVLPTEISQLTDLQYFFLSNNLFTGTIPTLFAALTNLKEFGLAYADFGGTFPKQLSTLTNLYRLHVDGNNFEGTIMTEFGKMKSMSWLSLSDNDFSGSIPTEFGLLLNMTRLSLKDTLVNGTIPTQLGYLTRLEELALSKTFLSGKVPEEICALRNRQMVLLVTDCLEEYPDRSVRGVQCSIPDCCSFCRPGSTRE